jgi:hypothetical protein
LHLVLRLRGGMQIFLTTDPDGPIPWSVSLQKSSCRNEYKRK